MDLAKERALGAGDLDGYQVAADSLWRAQHFKCCYCEHPEQQRYNDVEHYRPKAYADRSPGSAESHGYWWLAHSWENLLFACAECNRSHKRSRFPLAEGSVVLRPGEDPPGGERPFLIDPAQECPVAHIQFIRVGHAFASRTSSPWQSVLHWIPRPRGGSAKGRWTIEVCGLDKTDRIELYDAHVQRDVQPIADELTQFLGSRRSARPAWDRALGLLRPSRPFVGLSYDALRELVPSERLQRLGWEWPEPAVVGYGDV